MKSYAEFVDEFTKENPRISADMICPNLDLMPDADTEMGEPESLNQVEWEMVTKTEMVVTVEDETAVEQEADLETEEEDEDDEEESEDGHGSENESKDVELSEVEKKEFTRLQLSGKVKDKEILQILLMRRKSAVMT